MKIQTFDLIQITGLFDFFTNPISVPFVPKKYVAQLNADFKDVQLPLQVKPYKKGSKTSSVTYIQLPNGSEYPLSNFKFQ